MNILLLEQKFYLLSLTQQQWILHTLIQKKWISFMILLIPPHIQLLQEMMVLPMICMMLVVFLWCHLTTTEIQELFLIMMDLIYMEIHKMTPLLPMICMMLVVFLWCHLTTTEIQELYLIMLDLIYMETPTWKQEDHMMHLDLILLAYTEIH